MATAKKAETPATEKKAKAAPKAKAAKPAKKAAAAAGAPTARAIARNLRISPRKLNLVAQVIRGMNVSNALVQLDFSDKRIAEDVKKALQSAVANAENNHSMNVDDLVVSEAYVGKALVMKRWHARARGRGARILKPFSNLTIILREQGEAA